MRQVLGTALILTGCLVLIVEVPSLDETVVWSLSSSSGVHLSDLLGLAIVASGIALMWRRG